MKKSYQVLIVSLFAIFILAFTTKSMIQEPWPVPDKYKKMVNPVKADDASLKTGKSLYSTHCKSCHGTKGKGDGPKASQLDTDCGDFSKDLKGQTDGALFYKTLEGRKDMPSFKKKIPDADDIWAVVNYMRELD